MRNTGSNITAYGVSRADVEPSGGVSIGIRPGTFTPHRSVHYMGDTLPIAQKFYDVRYDTQNMIRVVTGDNNEQRQVKLETVGQNWAPLIWEKVWPERLRQGSNQ